MNRTGTNLSASAVADSFYIYIVRCADESLYVGHTRDVDERVNTHNEGRCASWTASRRPVIVVYKEQHSSEQNAIARERQLKRWTHAKKLALITGDRTKLKLPAKRRIR